MNFIFNIKLGFEFNMLIHQSLIILFGGMLAGAIVLGYFMQSNQRKIYIALDGQMLKLLTDIAMVHDNETGNHILRTQNYVRILANRLKKMNVYPTLTCKIVDQMFLAAPLHDIGKVGISSEILRKKTTLTQDEWIIMKNHPSIGANILKSYQNQSKNISDTLNVAIDISLGHHEWWDGSGYPKGLKGNQIPLSGRIMALADTYDALMSKRTYKQAWDHQDALADIISKKGIQFDPNVVDAFLADQLNFLNISKAYLDA